MISMIFIFPKQKLITHKSYFYGLVQERRNSIANALELRLSCTNPSIYVIVQFPECSWSNGEEYQ